MNLIKVNINNLTALWKLGGQLAGRYIEKPNYRLSIAGSGAWPNKLWFTKPMDMQAIMDIQRQWNMNKLSLPIYGDEIEKQELLLKASGFEEKLTQIAMSMSLEEATDLTSPISIQKVASKRMAKIWSQLFQKAFGYKLSAETVTKTMGPIEYFIGMHKDVPIGTAVLFIDQHGTAGIHSMGIIPEQRRKGFAEELLIHILNTAYRKGANYATLQASAMGKGLYFKTGFQEDFIIKTFINRKN